MKKCLLPIIDENNKLSLFEILSSIYRSLFLILTSNLSYWCVLSIAYIFILNQILGYYLNHDFWIDKVFFDADALFIPDFIHNLLYQHGSLADWALPGVTYLIPDLLLSIIVFAFSKNLQFDMLVYTFFQTILYLTIMGLVFKSINAQTNQQNLSHINHTNHYYTTSYRFGLLSGLVTLILMSKNYLADQELLQTLLISNYHIGQLMMAYVGLYLLLTYLQNSHRYLLIILSCLIILMIPSDMIFIVSFALPAIMSLFVFSFWGYITWRQGSYLIFYISISVFLGALLFKYLPLPYVNTYLGFWLLFKLNIQSFSFVINHFFSRMLWFYANNKIAAYLWGIFIPAALLSVLFKHRTALRIKTEKQIQFALLFILTGMLASLLAILLNDHLYQGSTPGYYGFRHMQNFILTPIFIGIPLLLMRHFYSLRRYLAQPLFANLILMIIPFFYIDHEIEPQLSLSKMVHYYPKTVQCLDRAVQQFHLHAGIATYWRSRSLNLFNHSQIPIAPLHPNLLPDHWLNTLQLFARNDFDFAILSPTKDGKVYRKLSADYGQPEHTILCPSKLKIYIYDNHQLNHLFSNLNLNDFRVKQHKIPK